MEPRPGRRPPSLYFNTGYAGAYAKDLTADCQSAVGNAPIPATTPAHQKSVEQQAWEIGCSEAAYAAVNAPATPAMWWADVETGNRWSTNTTYNDMAIDGIATGSPRRAARPGGSAWWQRAPTPRCG